MINFFKKISTTDISIALLLVLSFFPLMKFHVQSKIIIFWVLSMFIINAKDFFKSFKTYNFTPFLFNIGWLLFLLITLIYSHNVKTGIRYFQKSIPILIIPFIYFYFIKLKNVSFRKYILWSVVLVHLIYTIYIYIYLHDRFYEYYLNIYLKVGEFNFWHYVKYTIENREYIYQYGGELGFPIFFHKLYYSFGLLFSIGILVSKMFETKNKYYMTFMFFIIVFFIANLINFQSIAALLFCFTMMPLFTIYLLLKNNGYLKAFKYVVSISLIFSVLSLLMLSKPYQDKILDVLDERKIINSCNLTLFQEAPFFGHGIGGVQEKLNSCYQGFLIENPLLEYRHFEGLNSHNQYVIVQLSGGIIAILLFLMMLGYNFSIAIKNKDECYFLFLSLVIFFMLFENFLFRINGVLFFALYNSMVFKIQFKIHE